MPFLFAVAENLLLIAALPWLVSDTAKDFVARIDNRGMFSIAFCRSLAVACGGLLTIATGVLASVATEFSLSALWDNFGFWHEGRFLVILERYINDLRFLSQDAVSAKQLLFAQILLASTAILTAVNCGIAVLGWRSPGALRGLIAHCIISLSVWIVVTIGVLAAFWVLHWMNFWIFLVLLIVVELRRREESATRLSF